MAKMMTTTSTATIVPATTGILLLSIATNEDCVTVPSVVGMFEDGTDIVLSVVGRSDDDADIVSSVVGRSDNGTVEATYVVVMLNDGIDAVLFVLDVNVVVVGTDKPVIEGAIV